MAIVLSYASDPRPSRLRPVLGALAGIVAVTTGGCIVCTAFATRVAIEGYVRTGWCGTEYASLKGAQSSLLFYTLLPGICALVSTRLHCGAAFARVAFLVALLTTVLCSGGQ